jgi:hypothetical protein
LLFVGTETGVYASLDGGKSWAVMGKGLPPVAMVQDMLIHPRENDLIAATHGRGIFITNISPLQEIREDFTAKDVHLFAVRPVVRWRWARNMFDDFGGHRHQMVANEPVGLTVTYFLKNAAAGKPKITIADIRGEPLTVIEGEAEPGFHSVFWNLSYIPAKTEPPAAPSGASAAARGRAQAGPGEYQVILEVNGKKVVQKAVIRPMPEK